MGHAWTKQSPSMRWAGIQSRSWRQPNAGVIIWKPAEVTANGAESAWSMLAQRNIFGRRPSGRIVRDQFFDNGARRRTLPRGGRGRRRSG